MELTLQADSIGGQHVAEDRLFAILAVSTAAIIIFQLIGLGAYPLLGTTERPLRRNGKENAAQRAVSDADVHRYRTILR